MSELSPRRRANVRRRWPEDRGDLGGREVGEVRDALQYLTQSGEVFDVGPQEWSEAGLPHTSEYKGRRKRKGLEDYTSIILVLIGFFLMFGNDTGITGYSFFESIFSIKNINIFGAIFLILGILILLKKRLK